METPNKTPNTSGHLKADNVLSTPLFVPPTPMLKELGYGTGTIYSIILTKLQFKINFHCF